MSSAGWGKAFEGAVAAAAVVVGTVAVLAGIFSYVGSQFGTWGCTISAALVTYLAAVFLTRNPFSESGMRLWTIPAAALGGYAGDMVNLKVGGAQGAFLAALTTTALCAVLIVAAVFIGASFQRK